MLEGDCADYSKLTSMIANSTNSKMMNLLSSVFSKGTPHPQTTLLVGNILIDMFSEDEKDDIEEEENIPFKSTLAAVLKRSGPDSELKKKFINTAINKASASKADPRKMKSLIKDFERILSIEGLYNRE